ncbi:MAG TPA: hypothetical protein VIW74_02520 [Pyrinomonadaceae bacterium]|jgi:hypothetical protein
MANKEKERRELVSVEIDGKTHTGTLIITGTNKLRFSVEYRGQMIGDSRSWGTDAEELKNLRVMAKAQLLQLVYDVEGNHAETN